MTEDRYENYLAYFNKSVLNAYKENTHLFDITEEHNGGFIYNKSLSEESVEYRWYQLRYAYRKLKDDSTCVAAWIPDLVELSPNEQRIWRANEITSPEFSTNDPDFSDWVGIYLSPGGKFPNIRIRPIANIYLQIKLINALCNIELGRRLFKKEHNPELQFPQAENTKSYKSAVMQLNNLVNDEMDQETIRALAASLSITLTDHTKKLNSLKEILPETKIKIIHEPLKECSNKRAKIHGVSTEGTKSYDASIEFKNDLNKVGDALCELKSWLEDIFKLDAKSCLRRIEMQPFFPELDAKDGLITMLNAIKAAIGKTITAVEYGREPSSPNCHEREGLILHFEDGTSLSILIGSNAQNVAQKHENLSPNDFHTDLSFFWAPSIHKKTT